MFAHRLACLIVLATFQFASASPAIPKDAIAAIHKLHVASSRGDLVALRRMMSEQFTWSFGGDSDAKQAIDYWQQQPSELKALAKVTKTGCGWHGEILQCPVVAGMKHRAGFRLTKQGWRMEYFVAGD